MHTIAYRIVQIQVNHSQSNYIDYINHFIIGFNQAWDLWLGMVEIWDPILEKWSKFAFEASRLMSFCPFHIAKSLWPGLPRPQLQRRVAASKCQKIVRSQAPKNSNSLAQHAQQNHPSELMQCFSKLLLFDAWAMRLFPSFRNWGKSLDLIADMFARWRLDGLHAISKTRNI